MTRRRTTRQGMALAYGRMAHRNRNLSSLGFDVAALWQRNEKERQLEARGQQMCWRCEEGFGKELDTCPHCQTPVIPF